MLWRVIVMGTRTERGRVDAAVAAIVADGVFCLGFIFHLLSTQNPGLGLADYLCMALILCVLLTACYVIHCDYYSAQEQLVPTVKTLRIRELSQGASLEFDGKSYRVDNIDRASGEILIARVGQPGHIVVQIEGQV
jgi:hypothetical protein